MADRKKVLVVEDDPSILLGLRINLDAEGYDVLVAEDGEKGLALIRSESPDLVVLDVMLPLKNGLEVLDAARREGFRMPVIVLSAKTGEMDKVAGLELGAEDYVSKPFSLAELLARIRAALRRGPWVEGKQELVRFGSIEVDIGARTATKGGAPVELTQTEFDVLLTFLRSPGKVLTREKIFETVWGPKHAGSQRTIDNFMQQLRTKFEEDPTNPVFFHTVRGVGYRFDG
ncbi:MAG: response regulator transcription factor [Polyangiaceae bacterium]|nr:response regulator transcription factor [Polyangiaceae bacterium]